MSVMITVRVAPAFREQVKIAARRSGLSVQQFCENALEDAVDEAPDSDEELKDTE